MSTEKFSFGNGTCNPHIEVDAFEPVCAHDEIPGSEPLTLEVPVPTFVPIVPPPECTCLTFQQSDRISRVSMTMRRRSTITDKSPLKNTAKTTIEAQGDCCDGTYDIGTEVHFEVPECLHADGLIDSKTYNFNDDAASGISGSITIETWMKDCVPVLKVTGEPLRVEPPIFVAPPLCIVSDGFTIKATRTVGSTPPRSVVIATESVNVVQDGQNEYGCPKIKFTGTGTGGAIVLDLASMFGNGGSVFLDSGTSNLYTDGAPEDNAGWWYGGGIGDRKDDEHEDETFRRGPTMRGGASACCVGSTIMQPGSGANTCTADYAVPYIERMEKTLDNKQVSKYKITRNGGSFHAVVWNSRRISNDRTGVGVFTDDSIARGNLSMVLPSGFQWDYRGIALDLCNFAWNPSGLLSSMEETGTAALVAPAICVFADGTYPEGCTTHKLDGLRAGGLGIARPDSRFTGGLTVDAGQGLRIFGTDLRTHIDESCPADDERFGQLEVMYGPGFRIRAADADDENHTPQYRNKPHDYEGALVPNEGRGLRVHGVTKMGNDPTDANHKNELEVFGHSGDFKFNWDGKMVINDEKSDTDVVLPQRPNKCLAADGDKFTRNGDRTLRLCLIQPDLSGEQAGKDYYWGQPRGCTNGWIKKAALPSSDVAGGSGGFDFRTAGSVRSRIATLLNAIGNPTTQNWGSVATNCMRYHAAPSDFTVAAVDDANTRKQLLVLAWEISALAQAVVDIQSWLNQNLTYAYMHIGKAGTVLAIDGDSNAPAATDRHYQASAPTP